MAWVWRAFKICVAIGLISLLVLSLDWREAWSRLTGLAPAWLMIAFVLNIAAIIVSAWRWRVLVTALGIAMGMRDAVRLYWIGSLFSKVLPSTVGGDVVRIALSRRLGAMTLITSSVLFERLTGFWFMCVLSVAALVMLPAGDEVIPFRSTLVTLIALGLLVAPMALHVLATAWPPRDHDQPGLLRKLQHKLRSIVASLADYRRKPMVVVTTFLLIALFYAVNFASQACLIRAVGGEVTIIEVLIAAPLVMLVASLPISINGIGVSEGAFVVLYGHLGVDPETALAAALLRRLVITGVALLGVPFWLNAHKSPHE